MDQYRYYDSVDVRGVAEIDFLGNILDRVSFQSIPATQRIVNADLARPDLTSFRAYGVVDNWWLICAINGIEDPFEDMISDALIQLPQITDIQAMQQEAIRR